MKKIIVTLSLLFLLGCDSDNTRIVTEVERETVYAEPEIVYVEPSTCIQQEFDSAFTGKIVYEDGTPYKRGSVKAQGTNWVSYAMTDDFGYYSVQVLGGERFIFSAYSPFGDYMFYQFKEPLVVQENEVSKAYECEYDIDVLTCYENSILRG